MLAHPYQDLMEAKTLLASLKYTRQHFTKEQRSDEVLWQSAAKAVISTLDRRLPGVWINHSPVISANKVSYKRHEQIWRKQVGKSLEEKAEIYKRVKSSLLARVYATLMFPNFNKWKERKTFRMVQLDQNDWVFLLETLNAAHYGVNNDSSG